MTSKVTGDLTGLIQNERNHAVAGKCTLLLRILKNRPKTKESPTDSAGLLKGRTTEGTLGRCKSTVANRARSRVGGGVLIKLIKLAVNVYST